MEQMTYENPDDLKSSEEKWLKIFSKKAFITVLCTAAFGFGTFKVLQSMGFFKVGVVIGILPSLIAYALTTIKVPETWIMTGAGLTVDIILFRLIMRRRNRVIYVKGYKKEEYKSCN